MLISHDTIGGKIKGQKTPLFFRIYFRVTTETLAWLGPSNLKKNLLRLKFLCNIWRLISIDCEPEIWCSFIKKRLKWSYLTQNRELRYGGWPIIDIALFDTKYISSYENYIIAYIMLFNSSHKIKVVSQLNPSYYGHLDVTSPSHQKKKLSGIAMPVCLLGRQNHRK